MHLARDSMSKILFFTNNKSIEKHWQNIISKEYDIVSFKNFEELTKYLQEDFENILMLDENSCEEIVSSLLTLKEYTQTKVILLNAKLDLANGASLLAYGIKAYENAYLNAETLANVIAAIVSSKMWIHADLTSFLISNYVKSSLATNRQEVDVEIFTSKEKEVLSFITQGLSNLEIAKNLKISVSTVKGHIGHIFEKAGIKDRLNLALKYKGLV